MAKLQCINRSEVRGVLEGLKGRFITVDAIRADGNTTHHNGQLRESPPSHAGNAGLFTIKTCNGKGFRSFSEDRVTRIAGNGQVFAVNEEFLEEVAV